MSVLVYRVGRSRERPHGSTFIGRRTAAALPRMFSNQHSAQTRVYRKTARSSGLWAISPTAPVSRSRLT